MGHLSKVAEKAKKKLRVNFRDFWHGNSEEEIRGNHIFRFLSQVYELELVDDPDILIFSSFGFEFLNYKCLRIFVTGENFRPDLNVADFAMTFDYLDESRHYRLPFSMYSPGIPSLQKKKNPEEILASKTKFCNFVYSNPRCKVRNDFFQRLSQYKHVDSAGRFQNNTNGPLNTMDPTKRGGEVTNDYWQDEIKLQFLQSYKFTIAFENSSRAGYWTERLADAMISNTIPIYWGDPEISRDLNPRSFINCHDYESFDEVVEVVKELDSNDDLYMEYLSQPYLSEYGGSVSLNQDRFFDWLENAISNPPHPLACDRGLHQVHDAYYRLKQSHWTHRKFGVLSNIWTLYKRV